MTPDEIRAWIGRRLAAGEPVERVRFWAMKLLGAEEAGRIEWPDERPGTAQNGAVAALAPGKATNKAQKRAAIPLCTRLGKETGERTPCKIGCREGTKLKSFNCLVGHGKVVPDVHCKPELCGDYKAKDVPG